MVSDRALRKARAEQLKLNNRYFVTANKTFIIDKLTCRGVGGLERPSRCVLLNVYNILCTINTQHTSKQDATVTIRLYLATCFGRDRSSSGQLRTAIKVQ